ncbi:Translation machinery-associated protein 16 [Taenia solium]|eukprot:TsM_001000800 transcript=TsM_001000800 gene=TsM_001000800
MMWFKENIPQHRTSLTVDDLRSLTSRYLRRYELDSKEEEKEAENCSISMTIDMANELIKQEAQEFATTGLLVPDLTSKQKLSRFTNWNGEVERMVSIPLIHVKKV